jgi:hypothetical protein
MVHIFLREVNQIKFKFTPDYNRHKWMAQNIFCFVGQNRGQKRARVLERNKTLNSIVAQLIDFKYSKYAEKVAREVTQRKLQECWKLRDEELALEERR